MIKLNRMAITILLIAVITGIMKPAEAKNIRRFAIIAGANNGGPEELCSVTQFLMPTQ
ncbi:MAG: hypothetical protein MZV70_77465 [Desulfobacterales bacterium]|nr:hypothetical protein [Desulfobacterales bacterium]